MVSMASDVIFSAGKRVSIGMLDLALQHGPRNLTSLVSQFARDLIRSRKLVQTETRTVSLASMYEIAIRALFDHVAFTCSRLCLDGPERLR